MYQPLDAAIAKMYHPYAVAAVIWTSRVHPILPLRIAEKSNSLGAAGAKQSLPRAGHPGVRLVFARTLEVVEVADGTGHERRRSEIVGVLVEGQPGGDLRRCWRE